MKTSDFFFDINKDRVAQFPPEKRGTSRLMVLERQHNHITNSYFSSLPELLPSGSLIVINDSRVRKARVFGIAKETGGKVEFLFLKEQKPGIWEVLPSRLKKQKPGKNYLFGNNIPGTIINGEGKTRLLQFNEPIGEDFFEKFGHVPLPPYIRRDDEQTDENRYQTIYSESTGSSAAPTAGLHFTPELLGSLEEKGIEVIRITLHVGMGTFIPIRTENIEDHTMHEEEYCISPLSAIRIEKALEEKRKIIAVGTTSVRTIESAYKDGTIIPGNHTTSLYIYPGYQFKVISGLLTNFHTPGSSLLVLVSAFAGVEFIRRAYASALARDYRFFSYGDAMLIM